jgi:hypothetical protein
MVDGTPEIEVTSASDAHYADLLRTIELYREQDRASKENRAKGVTTYWYYIVSDYCPVCGREDITRTRLYGEKPKTWDERHKYNERYDWCDY